MLHRPRHFLHSLIVVNIQLILQAVFGHGIFYFESVRCGIYVTFFFSPSMPFPPPLVPQPLIYISINGDDEISGRGKWSYDQESPFLRYLGTQCRGTLIQSIKQKSDRIAYLSGWLSIFNSEETGANVSRNRFQRLFQVKYNLGVYI